MDKPTSQASEVKIKMPFVSIYTDGSCIVHNHPDDPKNDKSQRGLGSGGWAFIVVNSDPNYNYCVGGGEAKTTVSRMELTAAYEAVKHIRRSSIINIYTDSQYVVAGLENMMQWEKREWKTTNGRPVLNSDIWKAILACVKEHGHKVFGHWIKGHNGHPINEAVNTMAQFHSKLVEKELHKPHFEQVIKDIASSKEYAQAKRAKYLTSRNNPLKRKNNYRDN